MKMSYGQRFHFLLASDNPVFSKPVSRALLAVIIATLSLLLTWGLGNAQEKVDTWTKPILIMETDGEFSRLQIAGDSMGNVHVLVAHAPESNLVNGLDYLLWNGSAWSEPVNIIVNPDGSSTDSPEMVIDQQDVIHVMWIGGANNLYHASADAYSAGSPHNWSKPVSIGLSFPQPIGFVVGPNNELYVAYSDFSAQSQISLILSKDGGLTWSNPIGIAKSLPTTMPGDVRMAIDNAGRLHVTWTAYSVLLQGNESQGSFYTRNIDNRVDDWSVPLQFAGRRHGMAGVTTANGDRVHLVWRSNIGGDGTFHQWSSDGGATWSIPDHYEDCGGFSGVPGFYTDSLDNVHFVLGPVIYNHWVDGHLDKYLDIATAEVRVAATISDGESAAMAGTNGNRLHVIFETDFNRIWYTTKQLHIPDLKRVLINPVETREPDAIHPEFLAHETYNKIEERNDTLPDFSRDELHAKQGPGQMIPVLIPTLTSTVILATIILVSAYIRRHK